MMQVHTFLELATSLMQGRLAPQEFLSQVERAAEQANEPRPRPPQLRIVPSDDG